MDATSGTDGIKKFIAAYKAEYGNDPENAFAALGYDAVMLVADAIERTGSAKRKLIPAALEATDRFPAVTGAISFGPGLRIPEKEVTIVKADAGQLTLAAVLQPQQVPEP